MQRLLSDGTRKVLAERQRLARQATVPPSLEGRTGLVRRSIPVGNINDDSITAGWSIVKGDTPSRMQTDGITARLIGFEKHPVVLACVRLIANIMGAVGFEVYRKVTAKETFQKGGAGDVVLLPDNPAQALLDRPYYQMSPHRFRLLISVHYQLYGNWFAAIIREGASSDSTGQTTGGGAPFMLRLVHPERLMYVWLDAQTEEPILYDWRDRYGYRHRTPAMDMIHCADMTASDWLFGYPRAAAALLDIGTDNEASAYVRQVVSNDGTAGTVMMLEQAVGEAEAIAMRNRYYERNVQRGERGKTFFGVGIKDVKAIGFTLKDLEFPNLRQVSREDICACFGVDPRMVSVGSAVGAGDRGSLSGKQFLEARFRLIQETIIPMMHDFESTIDTQLTPEFGNVHARFSRAELAQLTEDETETWTRGTAAMAQGGISREEFRRLIGEPDKMDDTDTLYIPSLTKIVPVAEQFTAGEQQAAMNDARMQALTQGANSGDGDPGANGKNGKGSVGKIEPGPSGKPTPGDAEKEKRALVRDILDRVDPKYRDVAAEILDRTIVSTQGDVSGAEVLQPTQQIGAGRKTVLPTEVRAAAWRSLQDKAESHEPKMMQAASIHFRTEREKVQKIVRVHAHGRALRAAPSVPDPDMNAALREIKQLYRVPGGQFIEDWLSDFSGLIGDAVDSGGQALSDTLGSMWDMSNPQVALAVKRRAKNLAANVGRTTADQITAAVSMGFEAGMTMKELADFIGESVFSTDMTANRARTIARTESIGALNAGELSAAKLSKVVTTKEWLTQQDDRVRDSHADLDGVEIPVDDMFDNGCDHPGDENGAPEEVINCRCGLLFHTDE